MRFQTLCYVMFLLKHGNANNYDLLYNGYIQFLIDQHAYACSVLIVQLALCMREFVWFKSGIL